MPPPGPAGSGVDVRRDGPAGRVRLARPAAMNALDLPMIRAIAAALEGWHGDPRVEIVLIEAEGRAFCAGGDVRAARDWAMAGDAAAIRGYFAAEYALDAAIASCPKPVVSLIDGVCMGGGIGLSVHGLARIATPAAMFAMPETAIALFPDVGMTRVLGAMPGGLGLFLGLTGHRLPGADAVHAGLATHLVERDALPDLAEALVRDGIAASPPVGALPPFSLAAHLPMIERCFTAPDATGIVSRLAREDGEFAAAALASLRAASPAAVAWSFAAIRRGAGLTLPQAFAAELELACRVTRHPDFAEGVRAVLVDKDRRPAWRDAAIEAVDPAMVAAMLAG